MYLGQNKKFKFYAEEIERCPEAKLKRLALACERVEKDVWNACEDFYKYIKKQSALIYAKDQATNEVVGFALFDLTIKNNALIVAANECMVLKSYHGAGLPTIFMSILILHIRKDNRLRGHQRNYRFVSFVSATVNFKMMEAFRRYTYVSKVSSFSPDADVLEVAKDYIAKEKYELVKSDNLFFLKAAFPNAVKVIPNLHVPDYVPTEFKIERGDAFLYVCKITRFWFLGLMSWLVQRKYGFRFSKRLIPISRISRQSVIYSR
jgi:hypothetical protein